MIRDETSGDEAAIDAVIAAAFRGHPYSQQREGELVDALRASGGLTVSLVAVEDGEIVGQVAFSPVTINGAHEGWFGLGPVAVLPARQGHGIGRALIEAGLARVRALGGAGCVLVGDAAFYRRFGFRADPGLTFKGVPPEHFMALSLGPEQTLPSGEVRFHPAFDAVS